MSKEIKRTRAYKADEDKVFAKTFKYTAQQLRDIEQQAKSLGITQANFVRDMANAGIGFIKVREEGYTIMPVKISDVKMQIIEAYAQENGLEVQEVVNQIVDEKF